MEQLHEQHLASAAALSAGHVRLGQDLVSLFGRRGWSLYACPEPVAGLDHLRRIVKTGAVEMVAPFQRYILLPHVQTDTDADAIFVLLQRLMEQGRLPCFVDLHPADDDHPTPQARLRGVYLIDSVILAGDRVLLQVDVDSMLAMGMPIPDQVAAMSHPCIAFDALEMYEKLGQVTLSSLRIQARA
ncbi:MAG: hypothetical protein AB1634_04795 [Thermodesulfobacteriota bacterium]